MTNHTLRLALLAGLRVTIPHRTLRRLHSICRAIAWQRQRPEATR